MPQGLNTGTPLIQHGRHGRPDHHGVAMVVECGQHFRRASADLAVQVTLRFLAHFGLIDADPAWTASGPARRYELLATPVIKTETMRFARPVIGMETFAMGELIAIDGPDEIRSPCEGCTIFMPARLSIPGRELVYLTRPLPN